MLVTAAGVGAAPLLPPEEVGSVPPVDGRVAPPAVVVDVDRDTVLVVVATVVVVDFGAVVLVVAGTVVVVDAGVVVVDVGAVVLVVVDKTFRVAEATFEPQLFVAVRMNVNVPADVAVYCSML